jgi:hypothetical protein
LDDLYGDVFTKVAILKYKNLTAMVYEMKETEIYLLTLSAYNPPVD